MLIGHLPAGYLIYGHVLRRCRPAERRRLLTAALAGSVLPDIDLLYFYATGGQAHHHSFATHWPSFWLALTAAGLLAAALRKSRPAARWVAVAGSAAVLHLGLDSIAGAVRWLAPFSERSVTLVTVPETHASWIVSFVTHWTFGVEVALLAAAVAVWGWRSTAHRKDRNP